MQETWHLNFIINKRLVVKYKSRPCGHHIFGCPTRGRSFVQMMWPQSTILSVEIDRQDYYCGDRIVGKIKAEFSKPKKVDALYIKIKGKEKIKFVSGSGKTRRLRKSENVFLREIICLQDFEQAFQPGTYICIA